MGSPSALILVVEEDDELRSILHEVLADKGGRSVTAVASGAAAFAFLATERADLIVLDVSLPNLHGLAVYQQIRAHDDLATVPVLVVSTARNAYAPALTGSYRWLDKPFDLDDLDTAVDALLHN